MRKIKLTEAGYFIKGFKCMVLTVFLMSVVFFSADNACAQYLEIKAHIPWGWIHDFEFYDDGIFIASYDGGIGYFGIDENFNLTHRYTIDPGGSHMLSQFCLADSFLFALDGSWIHSNGTPVFFVYRVSNDNYQYLAGLEPGGTIWAQFDPVIYHNGSIIYHEYPGDYFRIDVSQPSNPSVTGSIYSTSDVCHDIITYQDSLVITARQSGTGFWDGNFRIILNNDPDQIISLGTYGLNSYTYTSGLTSIGSTLFTSHLNGLRVYDISDLDNVQQIYFYPTEWGRCVKQANNYIYMGCNNGWHIYEYTEPDNIQHLEFLQNDTRVLRMRLKLEMQELWCFVDEGSLGGLVVLDISGNVGVTNNGDNVPCRQFEMRNYPNPFNAQTTITFSLPEPQYVILKVYDLLGREIQTLVDEQKQAGMHTVTFDASELSSGIYFYRLGAGDFAQSKRMVLLK